jgi:glutamyl-tRNA reductase
MPVVVVGVNHRTASIDLLERLSISEEELPKALHQLGTYEHILEGAVLSTCNRVEVYASVSKFHGGAQDLKNFLAEFCHVAPEDFVDHVYTYHDEAAVRHLFRVASGLDSMVLGESEVLGQVKRAFRFATDEGMIHRVLGTASRSAIRVGKRARTETAIGRNPVSVSSAAVELARRALGDSLEGMSVAVVGAGEMGRLAAQALHAAGAGEITVVNRSHDRAAEVATAFATGARPLDELEDVLGSADVAIFSTTAPQAIADSNLMQRVMDKRPGRTLFVIDIAVPRDVEPSVGDLDGVVLRDIDDLKEVVESSIGSRLGEVTRVDSIIDEELERFVSWEKAADIEPTIAALVARVDEVRSTEVDRLLGSRPESERQIVDRVSSAIVGKLLHEPIEKMKRMSSSKQGHIYIAALRELFGLDDEPRR